jgi:hypothetical protein
MSLRNPRPLEHKLVRPSNPDPATRLDGVCPRPTSQSHRYPDGRLHSYPPPGLRATRL